VIGKADTVGLGYAHVVGKHSERQVGQLLSVEQLIDNVDEQQ
jgi:hypothetical protein